MSSKLFSKVFYLVLILARVFPAVVSPAMAAKAAPAPAIQDVLILEAWNTLYNLKDTLRANGVALSGEDLARFLLEQHIPVVWGSDEICGGSSCSRLYCTLDGKCSYEDGSAGVDPIYLNQGILSMSSGQKTRLLRELAHEAYHRTRPLGSGKVTQIEEYWAFYVDTQLVKAAYPKFDGVDPADPQQLERWFKAHTLDGYLRLVPYPNSALPDRFSPTALISPAADDRTQGAK